MPNSAKCAKQIDLLPLPSKPDTNFMRATANFKFELENQKGFIKAEDEKHDWGYSISHVSMEFRDKDKSIWLIWENGQVENYKLK